MNSQITVRLPDELVRRLDRLAEARSIRRSELVRDAIRAYLKGPAAAEGEAPFRRVEDLAGVVYGGPPDLGARHRDYLKERFLGG